MATQHFRPWESRSRARPPQLRPFRIKAKSVLWSPQLLQSVIRAGAQIPPLLKKELACFHGKLSSAGQCCLAVGQKKIYCFLNKRAGSCLTANASLLTNINTLMIAFIYETLIFRYSLIKKGQLNARKSTVSEFRDQMSRHQGWFYQSFRSYTDLSY